MRNTYVVVTRGVATRHGIWEDHRELGIAPLNLCAAPTGSNGLHTKRHAENEPLPCLPRLLPEHQRSRGFNLRVPKIQGLCS